MIVVNRHLYELPTNPAVKWLATQERNINKELPYPDSATETPEEYVSRTYLQFLWLPQSIMPLQFLIPALLRVAKAPSSPSTSQSPTVHPLHALLKPILLTSRASSQKYHTRISQFLAEETDPADTEEEYICYAYQKDKLADADEARDGEDEDEAQERLKHAWLERMERREVQIQILLHFLLLTLPGSAAAPPADARADAASRLPLPAALSPSKSKKRKRRGREKEKEQGRDRGRAPSPQPLPLEERLESYMDKLAMWQLMRSVDSSLGLRQGHGHAGSAAVASAANGLDKGKGKLKDDRDWMQAFCEDVVEPLFKEKLPELCALFRSKLFPDPANSDSDALDLSPPASPKHANKRLKSSASAGGSSKAKDDAAQRARSRSLSVSLEQEKRERSRSVSIGPGALRKRAIVREVSMSTVFKGKERVKSKVDLAPGSSLSRTQSQSQTSQAQPPATKGAGKGTQGTVLVAATPSKPRTAQTDSQRPEAQTRIPALFSGSSQSQLQAPSQSQPTMTRVDSMALDIDADDDAFATPTKSRRRVATRRIVHDAEEDAGDEWTLTSSPDVLLLGAPASQEWGTPTAATPPGSSSPGDLGGFTSPDRADTAGRSQGRILVGDTPTKAR
ncbi:hypothetical protein OH77DRAFT_1481911 [Trametes cingulata]|nr:hypothetical protein OH77DRAFT_1481911 [Trametes cingulata]